MAPCSMRSFAATACAESGKGMFEGAVWVARGADGSGFVRLGHTLSTAGNFRLRTLVTEIRTLLTRLGVIHRTLPTNLNSLNQIAF